MCKELSQDYGSRLVMALVSNGRGFSGWRIPVPGRLPANTASGPTRPANRRREAEFRSDLRHFLSTHGSGQAGLGGN